MKLWIMMLIVMIIIVAGGLFLQNTILLATNRLSHTLDEVEVAVSNNQWQEALSLRDQIETTWRSLQESWDPFIHNHFLDSITVHLARLKRYLETEHKALALAELAELEIQLVQLHEQEVLTFANVF